ncbi:NhaP-type Na+/H+ or K+/H+ antiporter [Streptomyces sp. SceaMP-e96]|uniref:cation:proton antiporter n=1 Tax=Streptomyces TaxID=1883 RepID=UPI000823D7DD|nr:cation:proton antiporter [Streptomyces sp. SceaMP-e96]MYT16205.1 sodium:proton antiporter [Streptomyces sp. SID4951]SCK31159.1 NhaP-type Na+/H+ or K+/H+ antiporter [Streptomyces sp. SceaMP-e96]
MDGTLSLVLLLLFLWCLCSRRMERFELTAPAAFVLLGLLLGEGTGVLDLALPHETVKMLAEITLVWVLFTDAARLSFRALRPELGIYVRLLAIGLPLCVGLGALLASALLPGVSGWSALYVGAALAPTDAALGATMMVNPVVPAKIRRVINVESGLNDGIVTPLVVLALAGVSAAEHTAGPDATGQALVQLAIGTAYGAVAGLAAGWLLRTTLRNGWAAEDFAGAGVLALSLLGYTSALAIGGNGFVAAFVAGLAFGTTHGAPPRVLLYVEQSGALLSVLVWLVFGAVLLPAVFAHVTWQAVVYAVLSLTVIRMVPVALCLAGSGLDARTVGFIGWFGPRGLASIIFGLLAVEELTPAGARPVLPAIACTVLLSVLAHGLTSAPLANRYGRAAAAKGIGPAGPAAEELRVRGMAAGGLHHGHGRGGPAPS